MNIILCLAVLSTLATLASSTNLGEGRVVMPLIPIGGSFQPGPADRPQHTSSDNSGGSQGAISPAAVSSGGGGGGAPAPSGGGGGGGGGTPTGPAPSDVFPRQGKEYLVTSGNKVECANNADCYGYREPNQWCPLPAGASYGDRGCWCDQDADPRPTVGLCVMDRRETSTGPEWSFCQSKSTSKC
jgi:hypothetical protein